MSLKAELHTADVAEDVLRLVRTYVLRKVEAKSGAEARQKICQDAFLRLRSCKAREDFVAYFTATFCSVAQFLPPERYQKVAVALLDPVRWNDTKALAMLALSSLAHGKPAT